MTATSRPGAYPGQGMAGSQLFLHLEGQERPDHVGGDADLLRIEYGGGEESPCIAPWDLKRP